MKKIKIVLSNEFDVVVPDDYDFEEDKNNDFEELNDIFAERIMLNNEKPEILFWESLEVIGEIKNDKRDK
jgi:hypothetical protein